jgi:hypothetical protein
MKTVSVTVVLALVGIAAAEAPVHAYLDPGTTSLVLQGILGAVAAAIVVTKTYWRRIGGLVRRATGRKDPQDAPTR